MMVAESCAPVMRPLRGRILGRKTFCFQRPARYKCAKSLLHRRDLISILMRAINCEDDVATLKAVYDDSASVPDAYRALYSEADDGKWRLTGIDGIMLADDHQKLRRALDDAREERAAATNKLKAFSSALPDGAGPDAIKNAFARVAELEDALKAANLTRQEAIDAAVKERIGPREREFEAQVSALKAAFDKTAAERDEAVGQITRQRFEGLVRSSVAQHVVEPALLDVINRATAFGWQLNGDGELVAFKPSGDRRYSLRDPTVPMTFDEWATSVLPREAPHVLKTATGTGDRATALRPGGGTKPWSAMTTAERAAATVAAVADGPEALAALQRRAIASVPTGDSGGGQQH